jgi:CRISPR-associated protein Cmr6
MNMGWMYYKGVYKGIEKTLLQYHIAKKKEEDSRGRDTNKREEFARLEKELEDYVLKKNRSLLNFKVQTSRIMLPWQSLSGMTCLLFTVTYPGIVIGTGYEHEAGIEGEFKIGFSFDHTTGLPIIAGSSIKGILRNSFNHTDYIQEKLWGKYTPDTIKLLEKWIFEGRLEEKPVSVYKRIIFFDAVILPGKDGFFDEDFLAPHGDIFSEPIPVKFLRVLPGSRVTFGFKIPEQTILSQEFTINAALVRKLFRGIILDTGVGAMTSYGYGHLIDSNRR